MFIARSSLFFVMLSGCGPLFDFPDLTPEPPEQTVVTTVPLQIPAYRVPGAVAGQPFARQIPVAGGRPPYVWQLESGSLPPGLTLEPSGRIVGTPESAGDSPDYRLSVRDQKGTSISSGFTDSIASAGTSPFILVAAEMASYGLDQDFGYQPLVQGGRLPWTFTITGLPPGLDYDRSTGLIFGTPTVEGSVSITIEVVDADGNVAEGSPASRATRIVPPQVIGGGNNNNNNGGPGDCGTYDGTWIGQFNVEYVEVFEQTETQKSAGFSVTIELSCLAGGVDGSTTLQIVKANVNDAFFGCQVAGCTPQQGSVAVLPSETPTSPFNASKAGHGLLIFFPSGAQLVTNNFAGALEVSSLGDWIQSSLDAEQVGIDAFLAIDAAGNSYPPVAAGAYTRDEKSSWTFSKSGL